MQRRSRGIDVPPRDELSKGVVLNRQRKGQNKPSNRADLQLCRLLCANAQAETRYPKTAYLKVARAADERHLELSRNAV